VSAQDFSIFPQTMYGMDTAFLDIRFKARCKKLQDIQGDADVACSRPQKDDHIIRIERFGAAGLFWLGVAEASPQKPFLLRDIEHP
jgi:hypothetical protein